MAIIKIITGAIKLIVIAIKKWIIAKRVERGVKMLDEDKDWFKHVNPIAIDMAHPHKCKDVLGQRYGSREKGIIKLIDSLNDSFYSFYRTRESVKKLFAERHGFLPTRFAPAHLLEEKWSEVVIEKRNIESRMMGICHYGTLSHMRDHQRKQERKQKKEKEKNHNHA